MHLIHVVHPILCFGVFVIYLLIALQLYKVVLAHRQTFSSLSKGQKALASLISVFVLCGTNYLVHAIFGNNAAMIWQVVTMILIIIAGFKFLASRAVADIWDQL